MRVRIRRALIADLPRLFAIMATARENRQFETEDTFSEATQPYVDAGLCWVCLLDPVIAGFVASDARRGTVEMLYVDPSLEGRKIARVLMRRALDDLIRAGHRTATLVTGRDTRADRFYRAQGWVERGDAGRGSVRLMKGLR
jgi:GNAT superfamily N-acetyltransferase